MRSPTKRVSHRAATRFRASEPPATSAPPSTGRVFELHRKPKTGTEHGLPKPATPEVRLTASGVVGDFNRYRHEERHDDPAMAILVLPMETIRELGDEGWPVRPGDLGENVTSEAIAYEDWRPGRKFRIGTAVISISKACVPCTNLYGLPYVGVARGPEFLKATLGRRGWYARVVGPGRVRTGDEIRSL
jgi:MOSC domain-containing protein YiiM